MLVRSGFVSRIHRKMPEGKPMPERTRVANAQQSKLRSAVGHVFAHQKGLKDLFVRTIGLPRARLKIGLANLAYNMRHFVRLRERGRPA
jgi:transposase, IS5 family